MRLAKTGIIKLDNLITHINLSEFNSALRLHEDKPALKILHNPEN